MTEYQHIRQARSAIASYPAYYNTERIHFSLESVSPAAFEAQEILSREQQHCPNFAKQLTFWSVTMYNMKYNFIANPFNRYSLGGGPQRDHGRQGR